MHQVAERREGGADISGEPDETSRLAPLAGEGQGVLGAIEDGGDGQLVAAELAVLDLLPLQAITGTGGRFGSFAIQDRASSKRSASCAGIGAFYFQPEREKRGAAEKGRGQRAPVPFAEDAGAQLGRARPRSPPGAHEASRLRRSCSARYSSMLRLRSFESRPSSLWTKPTAAT